MRQESPRRHVCHPLYLHERRLREGQVLAVARLWEPVPSENVMYLCPDAVLHLLLSGHEEEGEGESGAGGLGAGDKQVDQGLHQLLVALGLVEGGLGVAVALKEENV